MSPQAPSSPSSPRHFLFALTFALALAHLAVALAITVAHHVIALAFAILGPHTCKLVLPCLNHNGYGCLAAVVVSPSSSSSSSSSSASMALGHVHGALDRKH